MELVRRWWAKSIVFIVVMTGSGLGAYYGVGYLTQPQESVSETQQLVPVRRGNLIDSVTTGGVVSFSERETLSFGAAGEIGEVYFSEGQMVSEGDALASFSESTLATLNLAAAQAEADLQEERDALDELLDTEVDPLDVDQARADLADAEVQLQEAQEALDDLFKETFEPLDIDQARANLTDAEVQLRQAKEDLDDLLEKSLESAVDPLDIAQARVDLDDAEAQLQKAKDNRDELSAVDAADEVAAQLAVSEAQLALAEAKERLDELTAPADESDLASANDAIELANEKLANALTDLETIEEDWDGKSDDATTELEERESRYSTVFHGWLGAALTAEEVKSPPDDILAAWGADLESLFTRPTGLDFRTDPAPSGDDPSTRWNEPLIFVWNVMSFEQVVGVCEEEKPIGARCVKEELDDAWDEITASQEALETVQDDAAKALTSARSAVDAAERVRDDAEEALSNLYEQPAPEEIKVSEDSILQAEQALVDAEQRKADLGVPDETDLSDANLAIQRAELNVDKARDALSDLLEEDEENVGPTEVELAAARAAVQRAEVNVDKAEDALSDLLEEQSDSGPSDVAVAKANSAVQRATVNVDKAKDALDELLTEETPDPVDIFLAAARIREAQSKLDEARSDLDGVVLSAPFTGVLTSVNVSAGDSIGPGEPVFEILDETIVDIAAEVDEIDVLKLAVGAEASISLDALTGRRLRGTIEEIGDAQNVQGVVSYPVTIRVELPEDLQLIDGLSATASIEISRYDDVLLIPSQAVTGSFVQPAVEIVDGESTSTVPVELGPSDDFWVVVESGLSEGDVVLMEIASQDDFFFGGFGGPGFGAIRIGAPPRP